MLIDDMSITFMEPCISDSKKIRFIGEMSADVSEVLPYLNAVLKNATYNKNIPNLAFSKDGHNFTLQNSKLTVTKVLNQTEAWQIMDWVKEFVNDVYMRREEITPNHEMRAKVSPLHVYAQLPKTNCKLCGEPTCLAFASELVTREKNIDICEPLFTEKYTKQRSAMREIVNAIGTDMPE